MPSHSRSWLTAPSQDGRSAACSTADLHEGYADPPHQTQPDPTRPTPGAAQTPHATLAPPATIIGATDLAFAECVRPTVTVHAGQVLLTLASSLTGQRLTAALTPEDRDELIDALTATRTTTAPAAPVLRRERRDGTPGRRAGDTAA